MAKWWVQKRNKQLLEQWRIYASLWRVQSEKEILIHIATIERK